MKNTHTTEPVARLLSAFEATPENLAEVLLELGAGDLRFNGTTFGRGEASLEVFLQQCRDAEDPNKIPAELVPQSPYWLVDPANQVVGIVRVRHCLNARLLRYGGHIGYYVRPAARGQGYGKCALGLALRQLRRLETQRALLTVHPANALSKRVVLANGGVPDGQGTDPISGEVVDRYWIDSPGCGPASPEVG